MATATGRRYICKCSIVYCICRCRIEKPFKTFWDSFHSPGPGYGSDRGGSSNFPMQIRLRIGYFRTTSAADTYIHTLQYSTAVTSTGGCKVCLMGSWGTPHTPYCVLPVGVRAGVSHSVTLTRDTLASTRHRSTAFVSGNRPTSLTSVLVTPPHPTPTTCFGDNAVIYKQTTFTCSSSSNSVTLALAHCV